MPKLYGTCRDLAAVGYTRRAAGEAGRPSAYRRTPVARLRAWSRRARNARDWYRHGIPACSIRAIARTRLCASSPHRVRQPPSGIQHLLVQTILINLPSPAHHPQLLHKASPAPALLRKHVQHSSRSTILRAPVQLLYVHSQIIHHKPPHAANQARGRLGPSCMRGRVGVAERPSLTRAGRRLTQHDVR